MSVKARKLLYERDGYKCIYCGKFITGDSDRDLQLDHVLPGFYGGKSIADNLATCCRACNLKKHYNRIDNEAEILSEIKSRNEISGIRGDMIVVMTGDWLHEERRQP